MNLDAPLKIKSLTESGQFTGFAAVYGERDLQDDVIEKGAFAQAIQSQPASGYPLLWCHRQDEPLGTAKIEDSAAALLVHGELDLEDAGGQQAYRRLKKGIVRALSIGYTVDPAKTTYVGSVRHLKEIKLAELSLVTVGAQQGAVIASVKSLSDLRDILSRLDATACAPDVLLELKAIDRSLRALLDKGEQPERDQALLKELRELAAAVRYR